MKDRNLFTWPLFAVGVFTFFFAVYSLMANAYDPRVFALISLLVIYLAVIPIKLPNGFFYTAAITGHLYSLIKFGLGLGAVTTALGAFAFFFVFSKSFTQVKWFRLFTTIGMYFICLLCCWALLGVTQSLPMYLRVLSVCFVFDNVNLLLRSLIMRSLSGTPVFSRKSLFEVGGLQLGLVMCSLILYKLLSHDTLYALAAEVFFTIFVFGIINYLVSAYIKQIAKIEESGQRYKSLFDQNPDIVFTVDTKGRYTSVNPMLEKVLGFTPDEILGKKSHEFLQTVSLPQLRNHLQLLVAGQPQEFTVDISHKDGSIRDFFVTCAPMVVNSEVVGAYGIAKDITADKEAERMIHQLAYYDSTTGLPNRVSFNQKLAEQIEKASRHDTRLGLLYIDLDQFKSINDALGHHIGDLLLVEVSKRLNSCVAQQDFAARLGGDEFTIILPEITGTGECNEMAQAIVTAFVPPIDLQGEEMFITPSIGVSLYPEHGRDPETLVKNADTAMYAAKGSGGNKYVVFSRDLHEAGEERLSLQTNLRKALERGEFHLVYQPQLDLPSREINGVEALLRWNSRELGSVSPAAFIPEAEKSRLILPIGEWVLRTACAQNKAWQDEGYAPITVAVNLSPVQFQNDDLVDTIRSVLAETGLAPEWLELEITESLLLQNTARTLATLNELKSLGVKISMDDFGVGYSSLSYLKHFPFDCLKIDQSFIRQSDHQPKDALIIRTVIQLGHSLNMRVIAEGVETAEQLAHLQRQECEGVQGYLISKPLRAQEVADGLWISKSIYRIIRDILPA